MSQLIRRATPVVLLGLAPVACGSKVVLSFSSPDGGGGGSGGAGGASVAPEGGSLPTPEVQRATPASASKIDLLLMIDNSSSMADKQTILAQAVPDLVNRLVNPACIDPNTGKQVGVRNPDGSCSVGELDFNPVKDIHIGIIDSSLGAHGASSVCDDAIDLLRGRTQPHNNDKAHLVARNLMDQPVATFENKGFLNFAGGTASDAQAQIITPFTEMVKGVGQHGCGYEASLESIYRFLNDPDPYDTVTVNPPGSLNGAVLNGTDQTLLQQRKDFLRADSLVAVVLISDENDCSIIDGDQGYFAIVPSSGGRSVIPRGTSACLTNPNDPCCFNCGLVNPPAGCPTPGSDPECAKGPWTKVEDQENLRCWQQKRKYGQDFLYPVKRYIDGFSQTHIVDRHGQLVRNPLYSDLNCATGPCPALRDPGLVFVTGIVGVPWQDIANDPNNLAVGYKTARQLTDENIWDRIIGRPNASPPGNPTDPHMIESIVPRAGLAGPSSAYNADPIHGHEWDPSKDPAAPNADLQYACIFPLNPARECAGATDCDCSSDGASVAAMASPLCQQANGSYSSLQGRAKAYPGIRQLQVLQGLGDQGIIASICPANVSNTDATDYGYRPALAAILAKLRSGLRERCLGITLASADPSGKVACHVIEVFTPSGGSVCDCQSMPGRISAAPALITPEMKEQGTCFCEVRQLDAPELVVCETQATVDPSISSGWCYVDPAQGGVVECPVVERCPREDQRIIRFTNDASKPRPGSVAYLRCEPGTLVANLPPACP